MSCEKDVPSIADDDIISQISGRHGQFLGSLQSRLGKLQVFVRTFCVLTYCWFF